MAELSAALTPITTANIAKNVNSNAATCVILFFIKASESFIFVLIISRRCDIMYKKTNEKYNKSNLEAI